MAAPPRDPSSPPPPPAHPGVVSATATFPLEVARRRMMVGAAYPNTAAALITIAQKEGVPALFNGAWGCPGSGSPRGDEGAPSPDACAEGLGNPATGGTGCMCAWECTAGQLAWRQTTAPRIVLLALEPPLPHPPEKTPSPSCQVSGWRWSSRRRSMPSASWCTSSANALWRCEAEAPSSAGSLRGGRGRRLAPPGAGL